MCEVVRGWEDDLAPGTELTWSKSSAMNGMSNIALCSIEAAAIWPWRHAVGSIDSSGSASIIDIRSTSPLLCKTPHAPVSEFAHWLSAYNLSWEKKAAVIEEVSPAHL